MKIEAVVTRNKGGLVEIKYNGILKYRVTSPWQVYKKPLSLEFIKQIKIFDEDENEPYITDYEYSKEKFVKMKFLLSGNQQKFYYMIFASRENIIKIYYEEKAVWFNRYIIEVNDKKYVVYSVDDGYICHLPIYDGDIQIGEILNSSVIAEEYCCYLKDGYEEISDGIAFLLVYLDKNKYSIWYGISKTYTYNRTNKFYDKEWVKTNFGDEFYKKVDENVRITIEELKHPLNSSSEEEKKILFFVAMGVWIVLIPLTLFAIIEMLISI